MTDKATAKERRETLSRLLRRHAKSTPLAPHELVSTSENARREGLRVIDDGGAPSSSPCRRWTEDLTSVALAGCPFDEYLGLRFYREDPLPRIRRACRSANENAANVGKLMFVDHEFPVHESAYLEVVAPDDDAPDRDRNNGKAAVRCIPGIIASSNCRDFLASSDRKRRSRIPHFLRKAERSRGGQWSWVRGSSMGCSLFSCGESSSSSVDVRNIVQGQVGNCGFCSGFGAIAAGWPDVLAGAFGEGSDVSLSECGAASVLLFPRGEPRYLLMDDYVVCCKDVPRRCDAAASGNNNRDRKSTPSMHSVLGDDLWVRLLEKVFVKVQGTYASLDGLYKYASLYRHPARAMQLLTGAPVALEVRYSRMDADVAYEILAVTTQDRCARVVHCRKRLDGLIPNHGYTLLWAGEGTRGVRLACLRNPHGTTSYTGRYGFGRPAEELRAAMLGEGGGGGATLPKCFATCPETDRIVWRQHPGNECHPALCLRDGYHDNGIFFMEFDTFFECFPIATLVGPIRSKAAADSSLSSGAIDADDTASGGSHDSTVVPDCVHTVEGDGLAHVAEIFEVASTL